MVCYLLKGIIKASEIKVQVNGQSADFIFEKEYNLRDLSKVEAFIEDNKHLPEIHKVAHMEEKWVNLAEMN